MCVFQILYVVGVRPIKPQGQSRKRLKLTITIRVRLLLSQSNLALIVDSEHAIYVVDSDLVQTPIGWIVQILVESRSIIWWERETSQQLRKPSEQSIRLYHYRRQGYACCEERSDSRLVQTPTFQMSYPLVGYLFRVVFVPSRYLLRRQHVYYLL